MDGMTRYALLIIDMQQAYFRNDALAERRDELVRKANQLIDGAVQADVPVYNVTTVHKKDRSTWTLNMLEDSEGYLFEDSADIELVDGLRHDQAVSILKTRDSAFFGTDLAVRLRGHGVDTVILLGVSTHGCILQTASDAYAENFKVLLAQEAIASHDMDYHDATLRLLEQEYRQEVLMTAEILEKLSQ